MVLSFVLPPHTRWPCSVTKSSSGTRRSSVMLTARPSFSVRAPSRLRQLVPVAVTVQLP